MQATLADPNRLAVDTLCRLAGDPERVEGLHALVGEFCHLVRNRLNSLQIGLYLAKATDRGGDPAAWDSLGALYREAERVIEQFQVICRPMPLQPMRIGLDLLLNEFASRWTPRLADAGFTPHPVWVKAEEPSRVDPTRFSQALDALATWRVRGGADGTAVKLSGSSAGGRSRLEWWEDGRAGEQEGGALPLAVLARVASAHGGLMERRQGDGWGVILEWPNDDMGTPA